MNNSTRSCVVLLGASHYPQYRELENPSIEASARTLKAYFLSTAELCVAPIDFLDLFNSEKNNTDQIAGIYAHIEKFNNEAADCLRNLFIIYIGHGLPEYDTVSLAITATSKERPSGTALRVSDLAETLKKLAAWSRRFLILDCCYAAGALKPFLAGDSGLFRVAQAAFESYERKVIRDDPVRGTTVLCAADKYSFALAPVGERYTLFTGLLLDVLENGNKNAPASLTLANVVQLISDRLLLLHENPMPVLLSPDQTEGDLAQVIALFPNRAYDANQKSRVTSERREDESPETAPTSAAKQRTSLIWTIVFAILYLTAASSLHWWPFGARESENAQSARSEAASGADAVSDSGRDDRPESPEVGYARIATIELTDNQAVQPRHQAQGAVVTTDCRMIAASSKKQFIRGGSFGLHRLDDSDKDLDVFRKAVTVIWASPDGKRAVLFPDQPLGCKVLPMIPLSAIAAGTPAISIVRSITDAPNPTLVVGKVGAATKNGIRDFDVGDFKDADFVGGAVVTYDGKLIGIITRDRGPLRDETPGMMSIESFPLH